MLTTHSRALAEGRPLTARREKFLSTRSELGDGTKARLTIS